MKNTKQQPNSTVVHASLNALEDQSELANGTINHAWLVEKLSWTKKCGMTFLDKEECYDLIYNPPSCMIYTIPEEDEPITYCALELGSTFNPDSNFDNNDDKNNSSSSAQYVNKNNNNLDSNLNPETYITLPDLTKKQELKWFSNNREGIMPECVHDTDAGFDLRYPRKDVIKLEPYLCTSIDFKIALEISATTMVQLAFRSSLAKKKSTSEKE
ncbi:hypothetical protein G9A89_016175 [Geosiphon pyriformis]|nr:hypothetical protein G9A89_016175 [Geosiphon pyriformis]